MVWGQTWGVRYSVFPKLIGELEFYQFGFQFLVQSDSRGAWPGLSSIPMIGELAKAVRGTDAFVQRQGLPDCRGLSMLLESPGASVLADDILGFEGICYGADAGGRGLFYELYRRVFLGRWGT